MPESREAEAPQPDAAAQSQSAGLVPAAAVAGALSVRRGLPRTPGGEPWPPADYAPSARPTLVEPEAPARDIVVEATTPDSTEAAVVALAPTPIDVSVPLPFTPTVRQGAAALAFERDRLAGKPLTTPEPKRIGPFTRLQWVGAAIVGGGGLLVAAAMAVFAVRWLLSIEPLSSFVQTYPGEYHLPEGAPVGFPAWLGWQHFFNVFLIVLIIRSGLRVRSEKRPTAFWTPRNKPKGKISLTLWFHQSLDLLWIINGLIFVVLLFVTGQWMRIVPTSWEVFPNAVSAALQYVSLDWPTENGWVNYNALQQLAYFTTVFVAAPLAIITGVRMSGVWPKKAATLNRIYPVEWARKVHFPVMLYFVFFIIVHVALVFATGALRNLNHMYAMQGSVDPNAYVDNWAGFWIFTASLVVIAAGWVAARPLVLAPIAKLFGNVSGR
ncbi:cytochrome b/b6 domain-containing protein [Microbacterium sp. SLBN-146]|uniref:cytochrome b/b6 domain-containing protein n=1 Tax=Microbacterium sp. SLBN-146 TaxID=2768457 RepID=UPI0021B1BF0F|nr:cytochrome b/b6 domain-containing protein [Microbacterium sp. SLBN-146]